MLFQLKTLNSIKWDRTMMNGEKIRIWMGGSQDLFKSTVLAFTWTEWGKPWKPSVQIPSKLEKIQTEYLLNIRLKQYCYTNLF